MLAGSAYIKHSLCYMVYKELAASIGHNRHGLVLAYRFEVVRLHSYTTKPERANV